MRVQRSIPSCSIRRRAGVLLCPLSACQEHRPVKVDDLVVEPLRRPKSREIFVRYLFARELGNDPPFCDEGIDLCLVCRWEGGRERRTFRT